MYHSDFVEFFYRTLGGGSGGSGSGCLMNVSDPVPETHGGLEAGTIISGQTACDVLTKILYPYQYPQFTSFYIDQQPQTLEVGDVVQGGVRTFKWSISHLENVQDNSISIQDVTVSQGLASNLSKSLTQVDLDIGSDKTSSTINSSYTWRISAINTKNQTFSRDFRVIWRARVYWGSSPNDTLTENDVKNLQNSALKPNFIGNYSFTYPGNLVYYYIVYPDSWGDYSNYYDVDTGFAVDATNIGTIDITNDYNVTITYRMIRTTYQQGSDLNARME